MNHILSLKVYWYQEKTDSNPKQWNEWIDQIESHILKPFTQKQIKHNLAFGDFLFLNVDWNNEIRAFAICSDDHPSISIWDQTNEKKGHFTINLIGSFKKGYGKVLIKEIEGFAFTILLRKEIQLTSLHQDALFRYYSDLGYIFVSDSDDGYLFAKKG